MTETMVKQRFFFNLLIVLHKEEHLPLQMNFENFKSVNYKRLGICYCYYFFG